MFEQASARRRRLLRCARRDRFDVHGETEPSRWVDYSSQESDQIGFRVVRPFEVPPPTEQLWHWGIYKEYEPRKDFVVAAPSE